MKKETLKNIIKNGGATLNNNGRRVQYSRGYQVSRRDCYILSVSDIDTILDAVNGLIANADAGDYVGVWCDDGKAYIDISEHIDDREKALKIGKERAQISVYEWSTGTCIYC